MKGKKEEEKDKKNENSRTSWIGGKSKQTNKQKIEREEEGRKSLVPEREGSKEKNREMRGGKEGNLVPGRA